MTTAAYATLILSVVGAIVGVVLATRAAKLGPSVPGSMRSITLPFSAPRWSEGFAPFLSLELVGPNGRVVPVMALIDSGAAWSLLPVSLAEPLGIEEIPASDFNVPRATVHTKVAGTEFELHPAFAPVEFAVLGRADFFEHFIVSFNEKSRTFTLQPLRAADDHAALQSDAWRFDRPNIAMRSSIEEIRERDEPGR